jgi:hypothetical protein
LVEARDATRPEPESELRRVLLEASVQRRRAAELRLLGLQRQAGHVAVASQVLYPYKFAMGCVPVRKQGKLPRFLEAETWLASYFSREARQGSNGNSEYS